jgi:stage 0 sporulation regulatory protein
LYARLHEPITAKGVMMMCVEDDELEHRINLMRKNLILIAEETGLDSDDTLRYSWKLDELITMYQKRKNEQYTEV